MRTNPFYDAWLFLIGETNDHNGSGLKYLIVALFIALILGSVWIAWTNWRRDPEQRTAGHLWTWFFRFMIGTMWFQGSVWKLPLPVSGGFQYWTEQIVQHAAFDLHKRIATDFLIPNLPLLNPLVYLTEVSLAASFMLGFAVRFFGLVGIAFTLHIWLGLYHHPNEWPWLYIFLVFVQGFFVMHHAGRSLGLDALLRRRAGYGAPASLYRLAS